MDDRLKRTSNYIKRNWLVSTFVVLFAIVGATFLIVSFAQEPSKPYEAITTQQNQQDLVAITPDKLNSSIARYIQSTIHHFSLDFPTDWRLYKLEPTSLSTPTDTVYLRMLSPNAHISGESHSSDIELSSGAIIEVSAFTNNQFKNVIEYIKQLSDIAVNVKTITVNGKEAKQYRLVNEDQSSTPPKTIVTFFDGNVQYTLAFTAANNNDYNTYINNFKQILNQISIK